MHEWSESMSQSWSEATRCFHVCCKQIGKSLQTYSSVRHIRQRFCIKTCYSVSREATTLLQARLWHILDHPQLSSIILSLPQ